jgi:hypothetical protein
MNLLYALLAVSVMFRFIDVGVPVVFQVCSKLTRLWALLPVSELPVLEKPVVLLAGAKDSVVKAPVFGVVLPIAEGLARSTLPPPPPKKPMA